MQVPHNFDYDERTVSLKEGELIRIERSYKYTVHEALQLFDAAGLRVVQKWNDPDQDNAYYLYLVEKPSFSFRSTVALIEKGENPFGVPTLADWDKLWKAWDCVVSQSDIRCHRFTLLMSSTIRLWT